MPQQDFDLILKVQADLKEASKQLQGLNDTMRISNRSAREASGGMDALTRSTDKSEKGIRGIRTQLDGMGGTVKSAAANLKVLAGVLGVAFVVHKVADWTRSLIDANEQLFQLAKQAESLNVGVKFFSGLTQQADDFGVGVDQVAVSLATMNRQLATAKRGSATAQDLFKSFGIDPAKVKDTESAWLALSDNVKKYGLNAERSGQLSQLLSTNFKKLVPVLDQGAASFRAQNDAMEKTGQIITDSQVPAIVQLHNATDQIGDSFTALRNNLIIQLAPSIAKIADQFNGFVTTYGPDFVRSISEIVDKLPDLAQNLGTVAETAAAVASKIIDAANGVKSLAQYAAFMKTGVIDQDQTLIQQENEFNALIAKRQSLQKSLSDLSGVELKLGLGDHLKTELAEVTRQIKAAQDARKAAQIAAHPGGAEAGTVLQGKDVPTWMKAGLGGNATQGSSGGNGSGAGTPDPAAAARALAITRQAAAAQAALTAALIAQKAQVDPVTAAWETYSVAEGKANAEAAELIKQNPKQAAAINATRDAQIELARIARDSKLDEIAEKDRQAWQQLQDSLRTPTEVNTDTAVQQLTQLNQLMQRLKGTKDEISPQQYADTVKRIADKSVTAAPQYQGLDAAVGGVGSELSKNFAAQASLDDWHQKQLAANERFRQQDSANETLYQERLKDIDAEYAAQRNKIEQSRGTLVLQTASGLFGQLATLSSSHNKKMAAIGKAAAIAQAIITTYQSANEAFAAMSGIPIIGPALGAAAAAVAIAAGLANVAQIRAQPTGGYATGGAIRGPGSGTSDSIVIRASDGEYMHTAAAVDYYGMAFMDAVNQRRFPRMAFADGGLVSPFADAPSPAQLGFQSPTMPRADFSKLTAANDSRSARPAPAPKVLVFFDKESVMNELAKTSAFEKASVHVVGDNPRAIRGKWGS